MKFKNGIGEILFLWLNFVPDIIVLDSRPVVIMAQDKGRFGRIHDLRTCWAAKRVRPSMAKQIVRSFVHGYAAIFMALGKMTSLIFPLANAEMMNLFPEELSNDFKDCFVIMLEDGAAIYQVDSKYLKT